MELTKRERRRLRLEKLRQQSQSAQQEYEQKVEQQSQAKQKNESSKSKPYYTIAAIIVAIILAIGAYSAYSYNKPGQYDDFAKCLTKKGAVMYGAMDWCKYTQAQKAMFGKSFKYINYLEHNNLPGIKKTPTWVINGEWQENVQSFDKLSVLTGCKVAS